VKILLIGGGGREHALAWKIAQSPLVERLYAAPGNPGIARHATCVGIPADQDEALLAFARERRVDLTVVGPEAPLVAGLADRFVAGGLAVFGPSARAAALEGSKAFAKSLMARHGIPTARFETFTEPASARAYCREMGAPCVVKADGLAAGKGAIVCRTLDEADRAIAECLERRAFGAAGARVVVEEFLEGEEVSFFAIVNGADAVPLAAAQDHKTVDDGDRGPNTGGMGAYSPVSLVDPAVKDRIMATIVRPTAEALVAEGAPYRGVLYAGLMMTREGPKVIEFNCRFGDPECQAIVVRSPDDLVPLMAAVARGERLDRCGEWAIDWSAGPARRAAVCVAVASGGYPGAYRTGLRIDGVDAAEAFGGVHVFHAGTALRGEELVTAGGRVLGVTAVAPDVEGAIARAYEAVSRIRFDGMHYRRDIGRRAARGEAPAWTDR
jgi:phosphoribosylamine---glycine ligase